MPDTSQYKKFKETIWTKAFEQQLVGSMQSSAFVNRKFDGLAQKGKTVMITDIGRPTVTTYTGDDTNFRLDPAVPLADNSLELKVDQYDTCNVVVGDIDQAQSSGNINSIVKPAIADSLAINQDKYIMKLFAGATNKETRAVITTPAQALAVLEKMLVKLWENNVRVDENTFFIINPWFYSLIRKELITLKTQNDTLIRQGWVGEFSRASVLMSNYIHNDGLTTNPSDWIGLLTKNAIALASGISNVEAYRPDDAFEDCVKALSTYGSKIYRQEQIIVAPIAKS